MYCLGCMNNTKSYGVIGYVETEGASMIDRYRLTENQDTNYKSEFLEYLKQNGLGYQSIFAEENSKYSQLENSLITNISQSIPILIERMSEGRNISVPIHVFCIEKEEVNAFCFKTNQQYYIGIYSATYVELIRRIQTLAEYLIQNSQWEYFKNRKMEEIQVSLWTNAFKMILTHEYMHIILGHCDTVCKDKSFMWEISNKKDVVLPCCREIELQAMEMFADVFAAMDATAQILSRTSSIEEIKYELLNYYLAILLVFSIFYSYRSVENTHPRLGVRLYYMASAIDDTLVRNLDVVDPEMQMEEIDGFVDVFMEITKQFPELFAYDIVTDMAIEDMDKEFMELYNTASDILKITNQQAIYPIDEFEKMEQNTIESLNQEREILWYATQIGINFDEACRLIQEIKEREMRENHGNE